MADTLIIVLIVLVSMVLLGIIALIYFNNVSGAKNDVRIDYLEKTIEQQNTMIEDQRKAIHEFTTSFKLSANVRGEVGEGIVKMILSNLPQNMVEEQWNNAKVSGRPDFVISLPNIEEKLVIDAKIATPTSEEIESNDYKSINRRVLSRSKEIMKYITPGITFQFVLMWIPNYTYSILTENTFEDLVNKRVIPVNNSGLLSVVFLLQKVCDIARLNEGGFEIEKIYTEMGILIKNSLGILNTTRKQFMNSASNLDKVEKEINRFSSLFPSMKIDE